MPSPLAGRDLATLADAPVLSPLDGRYRSVTKPLTNYLSEAALNRARLAVEVEWVLYLSEHEVLPGLQPLSEFEQRYVRSIVRDFGAREIDRLAEIESVTRHDVKAVEYLLKEHLQAAPKTLAAIAGSGEEAGIAERTRLPELTEIIHIFCTSEDINNLSYALVMKDAITHTWYPAAWQLTRDLAAMARKYADVPMLSRTHGQTATPTTAGKELAVTTWRLARQLRRIRRAEYLGKFNGATGTYGAHMAAVPGADWPRIAREFVTGLGLTFNPLTTQIESHDWQAELFADIARFNRIVHNLATDMWTYISLGYFRQNLAAQGSTGSSTMPHKVNPIRFENAEANLEISCGMLDTLAATLVTSRLQRDLTDSTTQRNIGVGLGHSLLAIDNVIRGLAGVELDEDVLAADLDNSWEVLGEAVQQTMRVAAIAGAEGLANPYERLKELTRGKRVTPEGMRTFIADLGLPEDEARRLSELTPSTYIGRAPELPGLLPDMLAGLEPEN